MEKERILSTQKDQKRVMLWLGLWIGIFAALSLLFGYSSAIAGEEPSYEPHWTDTIFQLKSNSSYLDNTNPDPMANHVQEESFNEWILDDRDAKKMQQDYQDMVRSYEARARYDLTGFDEQKSHANRVSDFTRYVMRFILSYQVTEGLNRAEQNSDNVRTFRTVQKSVEKVVRGTVDVEVDEKFKFGAKTNFPEQEGRVWMQSFVVDGSFDVSFKAPQEWDATQPKAINYYQERYRLTFSRGLPVWDLKSGLSYGSTSTRMSAAISKQLTDNLSAQMATVRGVDPTRAGLSAGSEETLSLNYGLRF